MNNYRMVYILAKKSNYGWVMIEGSQEFPNRATAKSFLADWAGDKEGVKLVRKEVSFFLEDELS